VTESSSHDQVAIAQSDTEFEAVLPPARNGWGIVVALLLGVPWFVSLTAISIALLFRVEPEFLLRALLGRCIVFVLSILISVLAAASIWYAVYTVRGTERLHIDLEQVLVVRRALGIDVPVKAPRGYADRVVLLEEQSIGSSPPHRLEVHAGRSRTRMGAGIGACDAEMIQQRAQAFLDATRTEALMNQQKPEGE